jgi:hypothetical protein
MNNKKKLEVLEKTLINIDNLERMVKGMSDISCILYFMNSIIIEYDNITIELKVDKHGNLLLSDTFAMNIVEDGINKIIPTTKDRIQNEILKLRGYDNKYLNYGVLLHNLLEEYTGKYLDKKIESLLDDIVRDSCLDSGDVTPTQYNKIENFKVLLEEFINQNL